MAKVKTKAIAEGVRAATVMLTGEETTEKVNKMMDCLMSITKGPMEGLAIVASLFDHMKQVCGVKGEVVKVETDHEVK